jgi:AraC-like DNA-binding protein
MENVELLQEQLAKTILRLAPADGSFNTDVPGLSLHRQSRVQKPVAVFYEPALILVSQGRKRLLLGDNAYDYDPTSFVLTSMSLPAIYQSLKACPEQPSLCLLLRFNPMDIADLLLQLGADGNPAPAGQGLGVFPVTGELLQGVTRLVELLDRPRDVPILAPLLSRELLYRLLVSECGALLRQRALADSSFARITGAVAWLREHYAESVPVERLAEVAHMSCSSLQHLFKSLTGLSPGQYQKQLRLHEARRLMLLGAADAASASSSVGYESPSHFSREYRRLYGAPPVQDVRQLKEQLSSQSP